MSKASMLEQAHNASNRELSQRYHGVEASLGYTERKSLSTSKKIKNEKVK